MQTSSAITTRRVTEEELARAERRLEQATRAREDLRTALDAERRRFDPVRFEHDGLRARIVSYHKGAPTRDFFERTMTRAGGAVVCVITTVGGCIVALGLLGAPTWLQVGVTAIAFLISFGFGRSLLLSEDDLRAWQARLLAITPRYNEARERFDRSREAFEVADRHHRRAADEAAALRDQYERSHGAKVRALITSGWEQMQGVPFERSLADVFQHLGYTVRTTSVTGDHGADLLVEKDGRRIAVQAKGYVASTVGNKAVQEAHFGQTFYQCTGCAVVTNSKFTSAAIVAGQRSGCVLIDGAAIPALIRGEITL